MNYMTKPVRTLAAALMIAAGGVAIAGCQTAPKTPEARANLKSDAQAALQRLYSADPTLRSFVQNGAGYAIFPSVGKGGVGIGGSYGRGTVYENGSMIGYADITQGSIGATLGGQEFTELVVFENPNALGALLNGDFSLGAQASAVALKSGAGAKKQFQNGVAVFTKPTGGLMFDASVGGQKFSYTAASNAGMNDMNNGNGM